MKKTGFTLSEILVALAIIGIICAITIPPLMNNTNSHEFRSGAKKAISSINQALELHYALEGLTAQDYSTAELLVNNVFKQRMNVMETESLFTSDDCEGAVFTTTDGIIFCVNNYYSPTPNNENDACDFYNIHPCIESQGPNIWFDVNGQKKPNKATTSYQNPKDIYQAQIYAQKVIAYGGPTQQVLYDKETENNEPENNGNNGTPGGSNNGGGNNGNNEGGSGDNHDNGGNEGINPPGGGQGGNQPEEQTPDNPPEDNDWWDQFLNWLKNLGESLLNITQDLINAFLNTIKP